MVSHLSTKFACCMVTEKTGFTDDNGWKTDAHATLLALLPLSSKAEHNISSSTNIQGTANFCPHDLLHKKWFTGAMYLAV